MATSPSLVLEIEHLSKYFRDFWLRPKVKAVDDLSLSIQPGEVFGLLGPNGSGKSTTIKMVLGLLHPTRGQIRVMGKSPRDVAAKSAIGYLPEESYLYPYLNARETLDFYGRLFDLDPRERKKRTDQLLDMVGLPHTGRRPVGEFSKGMARRIGLAQALINDPELIILDEPTSGLDPLGTLQVKELITSLAERGKTVLLSSHLLADVEDVCDRVAILYGGKLRAQGTMDELLAKEDQIRLELPYLEPDTLQRVLSRLRDELGEEPQWSHPRTSLETYFQEVVRNARKEGATASGSSGDQRVADYLAAGSAPPKSTDEVSAEAGPVDPEARLQQLVKPSTPSQDRSDA